MITIALTGGVGTGKSTAVRLFNEILLDRAAHFDCDASVHELLTSPLIIGNLTEAFGERILSSDGQIDREKLREIVFDDTTERRKLEAILHPEVLNAGRAAHRKASRSPSPPDFFLHEVPLLYETDFPIERDVDLVVAASRETQKTRLQENRNLSGEIIEKIISSQMPLETKMERADFVIWNEGTEQECCEQIRLAVGALESRTDSA